MKTTQYIILTLADYTTDELSAIDVISQTFLSRARQNNDKTKSVMKVVSDSQGNYSSIISSLTMYNLVEVKLIMNSSEWVKEIDLTAVDDTPPFPEDE